MGCRSIPVRLNTLNGKYGQISAVAEEIGLHTGGLRLTLVTAIPSFLRDYLGKNNLFLETEAAKQRTFILRIFP